MVDRKISIAIPNYNRTNILLESFEKVYDDERISEIVISDDCSDIEKYQELESIFSMMPKVKMFRNSINLDCYANKKRAIELCSNEYVIILDSDNIIDKGYIDMLFEKEWDENTILAPSFASPHFDYRKFEGVVVNRSNVSKYMKDDMFRTFLNTFNFFINRNNYLSVWDGTVDPVTSDSEYFNFLWLNSGRNIYIVPNLIYFHRVWEDSHYKKNVHRTNGFGEIVKRKLMELT